MKMDLTLMKLVQISLKLAELVIGCICLGVSSYGTTIAVSDQTFVYGHRKLMSFITIVAGFILPTFLLIIVQIHERSAIKQRKSIFEMLYNASAVILHVVASTTLLSYTERLPTNFTGRNYWKAGGVMGLIETALYGASAVMCFIEFNTS